MTQDNHTAPVHQYREKDSSILILDLASDLDLPANPRLVQQMAADAFVLRRLIWVDSIVCYPI